MRRSYALAFGSCFLVLAVSGCESDSFMPPPSPELAQPPPPPPVTVVAMVLPSESTPDRDALAQFARIMASRKKVSFRLARLKAGDPPQRQAEMIRKAVEQGATALIVEPLQEAEVGKALDKARSAGVPTVLLAGLDSVPGKPFPVVEAAPYGETAGNLIEAALEDAKAAKVPAGRTAVVLTVRQPSPNVRESAAALEAALKEADVPLSEPLTFDGTLEGAKTALTERLESDPKLAIVLIGDEVGLAGVLDVRDKVEGKRPLVVAGFVRENPSLNETNYSQCAAIAVRNLPKIADEAIQAALRLAGGEAVPDHTKVPDDYRRYASKYIDIPPDPMDLMPKTN